MTRIVSYIFLFITGFIATGYLTCSTIASIVEDSSRNSTADAFLTALENRQTIYPNLPHPTLEVDGRLLIKHCTARAISPHAYDPFPATVLEVIDGDTLRVAQQGNEFRVRLWGIDAPEIDQSLGPKAKEFLARQTPPDSKIIINPVGLDRFGRLIATIGDSKSPSPNFIITGHGLAYHMNGYDSKNNLCLMSAQKNAKRSRLGVWGPESSGVTPWQHRKSHMRPTHSD